MKLTDPGADPEFASDRITRIITTEFPHYFAVITRLRQEIHAIGPEGGIINSNVVPTVQAIFPEGALTKKIKVGLQVRNGEEETGVAVSKEGCFPSLRHLFRHKNRISPPSPPSASHLMDTNHDVITKKEEAGQDHQLMMETKDS